MYYIDSNFPIYLYKFNLEGISSDIILEKLAFIVDQETFVSDFKENLKEKENQHLFGYLLTVLPSVILFNVEKFTSNDFPKIDNRVKVLSNIRIDITSLKEYLIDLPQNPDFKSVKIDPMISELITFLFQYTFVELSRVILASSDGKEYYFNIVSDSKKYNSYVNPKDKLNSADRISGQKNYIKFYIKSFGPMEENERKEVEKDLIFMSKVTNQKKRLKSIFERNIIFDENTSSHKRNSIFRFFFKNIVVKFFYKELENNSIDDFEVSDASRQFLKRVKI